MLRQDRFAELAEVLERRDGYVAESRAAATPQGLGLPAEVHRSPLSTLSGGCRLRVLFAQVLESASDSLLLDGHTSHLDILAIRWLEMLLIGFPALVLVIIHNHRSLDNCGHRDSGHRLRGDDRLRGQPRPRS